MCGEAAENTVRRWSMPWDCRHVTEWSRQDMRNRLRVPLQDRSRSTTPDSIWKSATTTSQDGLREAIQLLSCKPGTFRSKLFIFIENKYFIIEKKFFLFIQKILLSGVRPANQLSTFAGQHIPGVTLTTCTYEASYENSIWPDSRRMGSDHSDGI